jgi:uncharacterized protein YjcR
MAYSNETREAAKQMYARCVQIPDISAQLNISERTLYAWAEKEDWRSLIKFESAEITVAFRISQLVNRENKTRAELLELEKLTKSYTLMREGLSKAKEREARAARIEAEAEAIRNGSPDTVALLEGQATRRQKRRQYREDKKAGKRKPGKNDISDIDVSVFDGWAADNLFEYQLLWRAVAQDPALKRNRFILKSRQIGATYYFAFEAFEDAVKNGENQIFLSASKSQAQVFKGYIQAFAMEHFELELKGADQIELFKDGKLWATLYFLSTNANTAQSYHGHLYVDEVFWIPGYEKLQKVASGMASHKKWRRTYFSTPSSLQHPAYPHWSGEKYNKNRSNKVDFDLSDATLSQGSLGPDKVWRHKVTVEDAERMGCDLFDIVELKEEYSKADFENLFGCKFVDDADSLFPFSKLQRCMVDATQEWTDVNFDAERPVDNRPVAIGYDPSRIRDNAGLVVLEVPMTYAQKWRLIEYAQYRGMSSEYQGERIREIYQRYNVIWAGIDTTGIGYDVFDQVRDLPNVMPIYYSVEEKTDLVTRGQRLIDGGRFEYDLAATAITQSLMMICQKTTPGGKITYGSSRNDQVGHADLGWSVFHAMQCERKTPQNRREQPQRKTTLAIG